MSVHKYQLRVCVAYSREIKPKFFLSAPGSIRVGIAYDRCNPIVLEGIGESTQEALEDLRRKLMRMPVGSGSKTSGLVGALPQKVLKELGILDVDGEVRATTPVPPFTPPLFREAHLD